MGTVTEVEQVRCCCSGHQGHQCGGYSYLFYQQLINLRANTQETYTTQIWHDRWYSPCVVKRSDIRVDSMPVTVPLVNPLPDYYRGGKQEA